MILRTTHPSSVRIDPRDCSNQLEVPDLQLVLMKVDMKIKRGHTVTTKLSPELLAKAADRGKQEATGMSNCHKMTLASLDPIQLAVWVPLKGA